MSAFRIEFGRINMSRFLVLSFTVILCMPVLVARGKKGDQNGLTVAGTTQGNIGCMI